EAWDIAPSREIRDEAVAYLVLPDISMPVRVKQPAPDPSRSADGKFHAAFRGDELVVVETATGRETARLRGEKPGSLVKLDDHGSRIAIAAPESGLLRVISLSDQAEVVRFPHPLPLQSLDWSGDLLATGCTNRFIYIWNDRGELKHRLSGHEAAMIRVAFRPGGQELVSTSADPHVNLWHAARGTSILRREVSHKAHRALWWSDDGLKFYGAVEDGVVDEFSLPASRCLEVLSPPQDEPHSNNLGSASFSNDGRLAAVVDEVSARVWDFQNGRLVLEQESEPGQWLSARFSGDSGLLWTCGFSHELTERALEFPPAGPITAGPPHVIHRGHGSLLRDGTPDGRLLLMSNNGIGQFLPSVMVGDGQGDGTIELAELPFCRLDIGDLKPL
ncbi:MAG: WD40 repeat domain-containing protein, partial [Verrucomicrobiaceae bacterium]